MDLTCEAGMNIDKINIVNETLPLKWCHEHDPAISNNSCI